MKFWIMHDTNFGNGKLLAETMGAVCSENHEVRIGDIKKVSVEEIIKDIPDVLILGAAIRMFQGGPLSKKWLKNLDNELEKSNKSIKYGAGFITHGLPTNKIQGWVKRYMNKLKKAQNVREIYFPCFTGQVEGQEGPFKDGVLEQAKKFVEEFQNWMQES
ncbi:hypothetical protein [Candidatus Lokiarchaeum ossiferum]|uniref:hypothetical protein n=1 Tax=Candidatus Lokiarchaeum ossiferum TaxID=2951803 RepID=UPI00352F1314